MKTKMLAGIGAMVITMSTVGAVAYADTTTNGTSTGASVAQSGSARSEYAGQLKAEMGQVKSLQADRRQLNQELKADVATLKGKHLRKTDPTDYQAILSTHEQVLGVRAKLASDDAAILTDRQSRDWSKAVTDVQVKITDLQNLVALKQQQVQNLDSAMSHADSPSNTSTTQGSSGTSA